MYESPGINLTAASFILFVDCVCCCWKVLCIYRLLKVPLVPFVMDSMATLVFSLTHSLPLFFDIHWLDFRFPFLIFFSELSGFKTILQMYCMCRYSHVYIGLYMQHLHWCTDVMPFVIVLVSITVVNWGFLWLVRHTHTHTIPGQPMENACSLNFHVVEC